MEHEEDELLLLSLSTFGEEEELKEESDKEADKERKGGEESSNENSNPQADGFLFFLSVPFLSVIHVIFILCHLVTLLPLTFLFLFEELLQALCSAGIPHDISVGYVLRLIELQVDSMVFLFSFPSFLFPCFKETPPFFLSFSGFAYGVDGNRSQK